MGKLLVVRHEEISARCVPVDHQAIAQVVGEDEVVQVVTDNASNNMGAKKLLFLKRPNIFWTSCGSHTINLMLQGIGSPGYGSS